MDDLISRQAAIDALDGEVTVTGRANAEAVLGYANLVADRIKRLPPVHPDCDEWCTDCKEYDQQKHSCPRWNRVIRQTVEELEKEQPEIIRCRDCKHWKDSDGVYRRGIDAESKCPLNTQEVYAGTFYCGYAERRDENVNADTRV